MAHPLPASRKVAVIGAGAAGLVTARELQREGHSVQVYESSSSLGGIWNYQEEVEDDLLSRDPQRHIVHSSLYSTLRTNLPREIMSYLDFPFIPEAMQGRSTDARRFPHHTEVLAYLEAFADRFHLQPLIRFNTRVVRLDHAQHGTHVPHQNGHSSSSNPQHEQIEGNAHDRWTVVSQPADAGKQAAPLMEEGFDAVVICTGNYHEPNLPDIPGIDSFPGKQLHCHNFRHNEPFRGERVLVVGASFSGLELAGQVAKVAGHVFHSARTWQEADISKQMQSELEQVRPNMERVPMLTQLHSDGSASFSNGRRISGIDAVMYCTGYKYKYPFLEHLNLISTDDNHVHPLYRHIFIPSVAPTLAFIGLIWKSLRNSQFEVQARWVAQVLSGKAVLPNEVIMLRELEAFYKLRASHGVPVRYTHCQTAGMPVLQWEYNNLLRSGCTPPPPPAEEWRIKLHEKSAGKILKEPDTFRDHASQEDQAVFDRARTACLEMWQQISKVDNGKMSNGFEDHRTANGKTHRHCCLH